MDGAAMRTTCARHTPLALAAGWVLALASVVSACGSPAESVAPITLDIPDTVAIGAMPDALAAPDAPGLPETSTTVPIAIERATVPVVTEPGPVGDRADGNRVLLIGDSLMSSASPRYGGSMCEALTGFGWDVEINAQTSRFIDFGHLVVDARVRPDDDLDWDAAVIFLGNNNGGDVEAFAAELGDLLDRLAPRPTIVLTLTEVDLATIGMNNAIRQQPDRHPDVTVLDWAQISNDGAAELLAGDGLHLSPAGRDRLALHVAAELGHAPGFGQGECLTPVYGD